MTSRNISLQARILKALSSYPGYIKSLPSPLRFKGENELATRARAVARAAARRKSLEDKYFGEPDELGKKAIIRHILDSGYHNEYIVNFLLEKFKDNTLTAENLKIQLTDPNEVIAYLKWLYVTWRHTPFYEQQELLNLLSKPALNEIYKRVSHDQIASQKRRDELNKEKYGHIASSRGGTRKRKTKRKRKML